MRQLWKLIASAEDFILASRLIEMSTYEKVVSFQRLGGLPGKGLSLTRCWMCSRRFSSLAEPCINLRRFCRSPLPVDFHSIERQWFMQCRRCWTSRTSFQRANRTGFTFKFFWATDVLFGDSGLRNWSILKFTALGVLFSKLVDIYLTDWVWKRPNGKQTRLFDILYLSFTQIISSFCLQ